MEYYAIVGMVVICLIALYGFKASMTKSTKEDIQQVQRLNENIIKLDSKLDNMLERDKIRDNRIGKHGEQIDELRNNQRVAFERLANAEKQIDRHENRIAKLENGE